MLLRKHIFCSNIRDYGIFVKEYTIEYRLDDNDFTEKVAEDFRSNNNAFFNIYAVFCELESLLWGRW